MKKIKLLLSIALMLGSFFMQKSVCMAVDKQQILSEINAVREENGLAPYTLNNSFCESAQVRAKEQEQNYSHTRPDGSEWYTVSPYVNRENIAHIESYSQEEYLIEAWMLSKSHKENVLSTDSTQIGIGIFETNNNGECYIVTLTD